MLQMHNTGYSSRIYFPLFFRYEEIAYKFVSQRQDFCQAQTFIMPA